MDILTSKIIPVLTKFQLLGQIDESMPGRDQGMWQTMIMIGIALAFFYLILWRPEQKRRQAVEEQRKALKKGDRVTAMGIIGTVHKISEHTVILKMVDGSKIEFLKAAINEIIPEDNSERKDVIAEKENNNNE